MARLVFVVVAVSAATGSSCGTSTTRQEQQPALVWRTTARDARKAMAVPDNPGDRGIRRELNGRIAHDADLKDRAVSFIVANGDVSVVGTVRTEEERRKINDLAMNVDGVKSVANAVLIAE